MASEIFSAIQIYDGIISWPTKQQKTKLLLVQEFKSRNDQMSVLLQICLNLSCNRLYDRPYSYVTSPSAIYINLMAQTDFCEWPRAISHKTPSLSEVHTRDILFMACQIHMWHRPQPFTWIAWHRRIIPYDMPYSYVTCPSSIYINLMVQTHVCLHPLSDMLYSYVTFPSSKIISDMPQLRSHPHLIHRMCSHIYRMCSHHMWHSPHPTT